MHTGDTESRYFADISSDTKKTTPHTGGSTKGGQVSHLNHILTQTQTQVPDKIRFI